jgi:Plasmid pRiA4b ORF-3-like protein
MTRQPAQMPSGKLSDPPGAPGDPVIQLKVRLLGISPMIWRRVLVAASTTLRELHGVLQVAMGWQGLHLFQFCLRVARYGSQELSAHSPDVSLAALRLRTGSRFLYEYDLNVAWQHEIRIEAYMEPAAGQTFPACVGGSGACPPEDSGGPARFMDRRDDLLSLDRREDLDTMVEILNQVFLEDPPQPLTDDMRGELEFALNRARARQQAQGRPFSRRQVNASLHGGVYRDLMYQQC